MPLAILRRGTRFVRRQLCHAASRAQDQRRSTYSLDPFPGRLHAYFRQPDLCLLDVHRESIRALARLALEHRFDLLGSGWVQVKHGMRCRGLEGNRYDSGPPVQPDRQGRWLEGRINTRNLARSQQIWQLVDDAYVPIDWHLDFKSGYRWREDTWHADIRFGHRAGADIKVPWELARMQHLPQLAWAYALAVEEEKDFLGAEVYAREFRNQVLDFVATNPPRYGVNWRCTMDVAIRVVNWLVAHDLFRARNAEFDPDFERVFLSSVYEHAVHIVNHLEWSLAFRGNHYLSNVAGLLFAAAYLPCTSETNAWLAWATRDLVAETGEQFHPDGSNFEGSTCYHRLSAEMVVYATALILALPEEKRRGCLRADCRAHLRPPTRRPSAAAGLFDDPWAAMGAAEPVSHLERLERMAEFVVHLTKPHGHMPQIGDNDSGRFLKLTPLVTRMTVAEARARYAHLDGFQELPPDAPYWDESFLDHRHLVAAINGLCPREDFAQFSRGFTMETVLIQQLAAAAQAASGTTTRLSRPTGSAGLSAAPARPHELPVAIGQGYSGELRLEIPGEDVRHGLRLTAYPDFGIYVYQSPRMYLAVRCGPIGQHCCGGHAHNDQFLIELTIDGKDWLADPGSYVYTPLVQQRDRYRSVMAHFAPRFENQEPGSLKQDVFRLGNQQQARVLSFDDRGLTATALFGGAAAVLQLSLQSPSPTISWRCARPLCFPETSQSPRGMTALLPVLFSPGYGKLERPLECSMGITCPS